jgi:hypothetical protein
VILIFWSKPGKAALETNNPPCHSFGAGKTRKDTLPTWSLLEATRKISTCSGFQSASADFDISWNKTMDDDEHRIASRHRVLKAGSIQFGGGSIDCTVRNISDTGAALDVTSPLGIPAQFTLVTDGNHLSCRVVWRKEKRIGVTFERQP